MSERDRAQNVEREKCVERKMWRESSEAVVEQVNQGGETQHKTWRERKRKSLLLEDLKKNLFIPFPRERRRKRERERFSLSSQNLLQEFSLTSLLPHPFHQWPHPHLFFLFLKETTFSLLSCFRFFFPGFKQGTKYWTNSERRRERKRE